MTLATRSEPVAKANDRHDLYRWEQHGQEWACCAYDHGPMCRRCQPVEDGTTAECLNNVEQGYMEMFDADREGWQFRVTAQGERRLRELLQDAPDVQQAIDDDQFRNIVGRLDDPGQ